MYGKDKSGIIDRGYPVIGNGRKPRGFHSDWNVEDKCIIISRKGKHGQVSRYTTRTFVTDESFYLTNLSAALDDDYLYHFLNDIVESKLKRRIHGKNVLSVNRLSNILVIFPPIQEQRTIAAHFNVMNSHDFGGTEPAQVLEIRYRVQQSNKNIVTMLKSRSSFVRSIYRYLMLLIVTALAIFCYMTWQDETIDRWVAVAKDHFTNTITYLKTIPMSYV